MLITPSSSRTLVLVAGLALAPFRSGAQGSPSKVAAVLAVEARLAQAVLGNAVATVDSLLSADDTYTLPDGKIIPKARYLSDLREWWRPLAVEHRGQAVRVYADARVAIITGQARYRWQSTGRPVEEALEQYTDTYIRGADGMWRRAADRSSLAQHPDIMMRLRSTAALCAQAHHRCQVLRSLSWCHAAKRDSLCPCD
jgi:Domain of unknown function (DUF4440)